MKNLRHFLASLAITSAALVGVSAHAGTLSYTLPVCPNNVPASGDAGCTDLYINNSGTPTTITNSPFLVLKSGDSGTFTIGASFNADEGGVPGCRNSLTIPAGGRCRVDVHFTPAQVRFNSVTYGYMTANGFPQLTLSKTSVAAGTLSINVPSCPNTSPNVQVLCGTVTVTAVGGPIDFNSPFTAYSKSGTQANQFITSTPSASTRCGHNADDIMAAGSTCDLAILSYKPTAYGSHSFTLTATPRAGGDTPVTVSAEAAPPYGTAVVNASGVTCSGTQGIAATCSGAVSITASGGPVLLNATPISVGGSHSSDFSIPSGACAGANLTSGASCDLGTITFTAGAAGTRSATVTSSVANGTADSDTLTGTGAAQGSASISSLICGNAGIGTTKACSGTIAVTASGGAIKLAATPYALTGHTPQFTDAAATTGACAGGQTLASGASCNLITVSQYTPTSAGAHTLTVTVTPAIGTADTGTVTGTGVYGTATVNGTGVTCSGTVGLSATCSGTATITASNGQVILNATPATIGGTHAADFSVAVGTCASATLANGASCNLGSITFMAGAAGARTATLNSSVASGVTDSDALSGTGAGAGSAVVNSISCGSAGIGTTKTCSGTIAVTATGGTIKLAATPSTLTGNGSQFADAVPSTNACVADQTLASGASCNLRTVSQYTPTGAGAHTLTITATPAIGASGVGTITGTGTYGTATVGVTGVSCSGTVGIAATCSGAATITATNGQVILNATPVTLSGTNAADFSVGAGTCASANLASGTSCNLGTVTFTAGAAGTRSATITSSVANGSADSDTLSGTGAGAGAATVSNVSCGNAGVGTTATCTGTISITATGGNVKLGTTTHTVTGATTQFTYAAASTTPCSASQVLASGASCNLITVSQFKPTSAGAQTLTVNVTPSSGTADTGTVSGTGVYGAASVSTAGVSCTGNVGVATSCTGNIVVTASGGQITLGSTIFTKSGTNAADFSIATSASGACTASQTLASGATCNLGPITFTASGGGSRTTTVTVTPTNGTAGNATLTGTASYGTATVSVAGVACSSTTGLAANCSGTATINATGGQVILNATPVTLSGTNAADFNVASGACASATLASGTSCNLGTITFTPGAAGTRSVTLTSSAASGTNASATLTGSGIAAGAANVSAVSCGSAGIGTTATCAGTVSVTAAGGSIKLGTTPYAVTGSTSEFTYAAAGTNACSANQVLANGSSCSLITLSQFKPTSAGARSMTVTVTPAIGAADSNTVSGTGGYGSANITGSVSCSGFIGVESACTGTLTVTASNGRIVLATPAFDLSGTNAADFSVATGTCTAGLSLNNGTSCSLGTVTFTAGGAGARSATLRVAPANGSQDTVALSGTGNWGSASVSTSSINCGSIGAGLSKSCATFTVTAQSGRIQLAAMPLTNTNTPDFRVLLGQCTGNAVLEVGESCTTGAITFHPTAVGARSATIQVVLTNGSGPAVTLNGTGLAGAASAMPGSLNCGTATVGSNGSCGTVTVTATGGPVTLAATPLSASGVFSAAVGTCTAGKVLAVNDSCTTGAVTFSPTAAGTSTGTLSVNCGTGCTDTVSLTGVGYAYAWDAGNWGSCVGGAGTWQMGAWEPAQGCGMTTQTRSSSCAANAGSAIQSRAVTCLRSDGTGTVAVDDALCADPKPNVSQSCTPTSGFSCGNEPATSQSVELTNTCSYEWQAREWGAWDSTCSENATRTRVVECERSDGTVADDEMCHGTKPTASETQEVLTSCTYSWIASGFGACAGGTYSWATGTWAPTMGCGQVQQTRQVTCAVDVNSGTHAQSVGCRRSDGVDVFASFCDVETRPATTEACTPPQSLCVDPPLNTQTVTLDTSCVRDAILSGCQIAADTPFCVAVPL